MAKAKTQSRRTKSSAQNERGMLITVTAVVGLVFLIAIVLIVLQIRNSTTVGVSSGGYAEIPRIPQPMARPYSAAQRPK